MWEVINVCQYVLWNVAIFLQTKLKNLEGHRFILWGKVYKNKTFVRLTLVTPYTYWSCDHVYLLCCSSTPSVLPSHTRGDVCGDPLWPFWRWCDPIWSPLPSWQTSCTECRPAWGQCPQWPAVCYRCCGPSRTSCDSVREAKNMCS